MFVKFLKINAILLLISSLSLAETINDITVSGNKRISKESIAIFGDISLNKNYNDGDLNIIFKNIYETNIFLHRSKPFQSKSWLSGCFINTPKNDF